MPTKYCSVCQTEFTCSANQADQSCWCDTLPAIMPAEFAQDCRCPSCLAQAIAIRIDEAIKSTAHEPMLVIASQYRSQMRLIEYIDYTLENGNYIFTRWYHLKRGACCGNNCRNCPY